MKESTIQHFKPGEGPSRGLLCDCEIFANLRLKQSVKSVQSRLQLSTCTAVSGGIKIKVRRPHQVSSVGHLHILHPINHSVKKNWIAIYWRCRSVGVGMNLYAVCTKCCLCGPTLRSPQLADIWLKLLQFSTDNTQSVAQSHSANNPTPANMTFKVKVNISPFDFEMYRASNEPSAKFSQSQ